MMSEKTGLAAVMCAPRTALEFKRYPLPDVAPACILAKVTCCTICGSDLHTWSGRRPSPVPVILGHEIVGSVVALGEGVARDAKDQLLHVGDRITWTLMDSCGKCYYCAQKGLPMKCRDLKKYGHDSCETSPHFVGGFAEYCYLTPGTRVFKVPEAVTNEEAAPANCALATALAGFDAADVEPFETVLIQGAGTLGIYAAALASHLGCRSVLVTDLLDHRLEFAKDFGATHTLHTLGMSEEEIVSWVREWTDGFGVDCAFEMAGSSDLVSVGLDSLRIGGRFVEIGTTFPGAEFSCDAYDFVRRRLTLTGVHNYDARHLDGALAFLSAAKDKFPFGRLVTHRYPLRQIDAALEMAASQRAMRVAVLPCEA